MGPSTGLDFWSLLEILASPLLLSIWVFKEWRIFRRDCPNRRFQFVITDIWAATVGLTPSFFLVAHGIHLSREMLLTDIPIGVLAWILVNLAPLIFGQFAGIIVYKLRYERREGISNWKRSAGAIIFGAIVGPLAGFMAIMSTVPSPFLVVFLPLTLIFILHESGKSKAHSS